MNKERPIPLQIATAFFAFMIIAIQLCERIEDNLIAKNPYEYIPRFRELHLDGIRKTFTKSPLRLCEMVDELISDSDFMSRMAKLGIKAKDIEQIAREIEILNC